MIGLVTLFGGGGFLGRYVAQELLRHGVRVRFAQRVPRDAWFVKTLGGLGQTQFVAADVTRPETVARALVGADAVVNLVGALLIGLVVATAPQWASYETEKLITAGCLGGLTTFSTFSLEIFQLIESKNLGVAVAYGLGSVVLGVLGVALGFKLGS